MPKYDHENFGDVMNHIYAKGVITSVNSSDDTADVTVDGYKNGTAIPIFYHCEPDSEERSNGAIEGAAAGFTVDDEVIVMCRADGEPVRIVGHVDGIKACGSTYLMIYSYISDYVINRKEPCQSDPGHAACQEYAIVWDLKKNRQATGVIDNAGDPVTSFPVLKSEISDWWDEQEFFSGIELLFDLDIISENPTGWSCSGPSDDRVCTATNVFGTSSSHYTEAETFNGDMEGLYGDMWCSGTFTTTLTEDLYNGKRYTAQNGSGEILDLIVHSEEENEDYSWGSWAEGAGGDGGTTESASESVSVAFPIFNDVQSGSRSRSATCTGEPNDFLRCVTSCDPFEGGESWDEIEILGIPCGNCFALIGTYYEDEDSGEKWIWFVASREDNENRPLDENGNEEVSFGAYEAYAACESMEDANVDQAPSSMTKNTDFTDLCQALFDLNNSGGRALALSLQYEIRRTP